MEVHTDPEAGLEEERSLPALKARNHSRMGEVQEGAHNRLRSVSEVWTGVARVVVDIRRLGQDDGGGE